MVSFLSIEIKLYSFKYSNVGNSQNSNIFTILKTFKNARKYDLTSDCRFLQPQMKYLYIYNCNLIFDFREKLYPHWVLEETSGFHSILYLCLYACLSVSLSGRPRRFLAIIKARPVIVRSACGRSPRVQIP